MSVLAHEYLIFLVGCCRRWFSMRVSRFLKLDKVRKSYQELRLIHGQHATVSCVGDIEQGIHPGFALNWDFFHSLESTLCYRFLVGNGIRSSKSRKMYIQCSIHLKMGFL
jgi:hypothetical protein